MSITRIVFSASIITVPFSNRYFDVYGCIAAQSSAHVYFAAQRGGPFRNRAWRKPDCLRTQTLIFDPDIEPAVGALEFDEAMPCTGVFADVAHPFTDYLEHLRSQAIADVKLAVRADCDIDPVE